jgi:hypothetical protein
MSQYNIETKKNFRISPSQKLLGKQNYTYCHGMVDENDNPKYCCTDDKKLKHTVSRDSQKTWDEGVVYASEDGAKKIAEMNAKKKKHFKSTDPRISEALKNPTKHPNICKVNDCIVSNNEDKDFWGEEDNINDCMCKHVKETCDTAFRKSGMSKFDCDKFNAGQHNCNYIESHKSNFPGSKYREDYFKGLTKRYPDRFTIAKQAMDKGITRYKWKQDIIDSHKNMMNSIVQPKFKFLKTELILQFLELEVDSDDEFIDEKNPGGYNLPHVNLKLLLSQKSKSYLYKDMDSETKKLYKDIFNDIRFININHWVYYFTLIQPDKTRISQLKDYLEKNGINDDNINTANKKLGKLKLLKGQYMDFYTWITLFPDKGKFIVDDLIKVMKEENERVKKQFKSQKIRKPMAKSKQMNNEAIRYNIFNIETDRSNWNTFDSDRAKLQQKLTYVPQNMPIGQFDWLKIFKNVKKKYPEHFSEYKGGYRKKYKTRKNKPKNKKSKKII